MKTYPPFSKTQQRLASMRWREIKQMAPACGVPFETLDKISRGVTSNPRVGTAERIAEYFAAVK